MSVTSLEEARLLEGEYRAAGSDLLARRRYRVASGPVVDLSRISGLDELKWKGKTLTLGSMVRLATIASEEKVIANYPGLAMAAGSLATPQIRNMATLGGSLLQRTRCSYFRHPDASCYKKGGEGCPAREGEHRFGVCFEKGQCVYPHPSTLAMVLMAYEAVVEIHQQDSRSLEELLGDGCAPNRENALGDNDIVTHVILKGAWKDEYVSYFRATARARAEWPLVEVIARFTTDAKGVVKKARLALGGVATVPFRIPQVEEALVGREASEENFREVSRLASEGARPLPGTAYKVPLLEDTVFETLQRAHQRIWGGEG